MPYSLLYVSKTLLADQGADAEVASIVAHSAARNARLGITGALIATPAYFAQVLEGEQPAVAELMRSINKDARHMGIKIIRTREEPRRFAGWSMAYSGRASFVGRQIAPLFSAMAATDSQHLGQKLIGLMQDFTRLPPA